MLGVSKTSSATRWPPFLSRQPNKPEEAREHDLRVMSQQSKHHEVDLPSTSPSCADCKRRSEQRYYRGYAHPPLNVAVPKQPVDRSLAAALRITLNMVCPKSTISRPAEILAQLFYTQNLTCLLLCCIGTTPLTGEKVRRD